MLHTLVEKLHDMGAKNGDILRRKCLPQYMCMSSRLRKFGLQI